MAVNEGDILRQLESEGVGTKGGQIYINHLTLIADQIIEDLKENIRTKSKSGGNHLRQSLTAIPTRNGLVIEGDFYYKFFDDGVDGAGETNKKGERKRKKGRVVITGSPYKFKTRFASKKMERSIAQWSGRSIGQNYGTAINIKKYGIKAHNVTESVITDKMLNQIAQDLLTITGLNFEFSFDKAFGDSVK